MSQSLKMAFKSIAGNKMRAFLTMLGIIIGVMALVTLVSLVNGAASSVTDTISGLGNNLLTVTVEDNKGTPVKLKDLNHWMEEDSIGLIAPAAEESMTGKYGAENSSVEVYGTTPCYETVQGLSLLLGRFLKTTDVECHNMVCVINETLFYKGRNGVYAYTGGTPELLTGCFGIRRFSDAVAGSDGQRYYISMENEEGTSELYVFDPRRGIWLREDNTRAVDFACLDGSLYYLDGDSKKVMISGQDGSEEGRVEWSATLCRMEENTHGRKTYSRLLLRADMEAGSWLKVEVSHDAAPFRTVFVTHNDRKKTVVIPILPVRCDSFRIRLSGKGVCVIESLVREYAVGSDY